MRGDAVGRAGRPRPAGGEPPPAGRLARVRIVPFLPRGISRLTLEMTTRTFGFKADEAVGRAGRPRPAA